MIVTKKKYAQLCGCTPQAIYARIAKKQIKTTVKKLPDGSKEDYIDTDKFPPKRLRVIGGGRKKKVVKNKVVK